MSERDALVVLAEGLVWPKVSCLEDVAPEDRDWYASSMLDLGWLESRG